MKGKEEQEAGQRWGRRQPKPAQACGSNPRSSWLIKGIFEEKQDLPTFLKLVAVFYFSSYPDLLPSSLFLNFQAIHLSFSFPAKVTAKCMST